MEHISNKIVSKSLRQLIIRKVHIGRFYVQVAVGQNVSLINRYCHHSEFPMLCEMGNTTSGLIFYYPDMRYAIFGELAKSTRNIS